MIRFSCRPTLLFALAMLASCGRPDPDAPAEVSAISDFESLVAQAGSQGLVRQDGAGRIEPGLAIRWAISEDGLFYTFRLDRSDSLDANAVARKLRARIRNAPIPFKPMLSAIEEVVAVTPEVVEIRLSTPRPSLLDLLAQPELGIEGSGPLLADAQTNGQIQFYRPDAESDVSHDRIRIRAERSSVAILAFINGKRDLVLGGKIGDWPLVQLAQPRPRDLRFDPVQGLFGLAVARTDGPLADPGARRALAMSIDRARLAEAFRLPDWAMRETLLAPNATEVSQPATPDWAGLSLERRRTVARAEIARWRAENRGVLPLIRVTLPPGPGGKLLFHRIAADWGAIGVALRIAEPGEIPGLRLIDATAPVQTAFWYLGRFTCARSPTCSPEADRAIAAAAVAADPAERATLLAEADAYLSETAAFIPLAQPLRWFLVAPRLTGVEENDRGVHPLNHLLATPR